MAEIEGAKSSRGSIRGSYIARRSLSFVLFACLTRLSRGQVLDAKALAARRGQCQALLLKPKQDHLSGFWREADCDFLTSRDESGREIVPYQFKYLPYAAMVQRMKYLELMYPEYISLSDANSKYSLPVVGTCSEDTRGILQAGCKVWILELGRRHTPHDATRPRVFLSGALHGDERVGPTALLEFASFLLGRVHHDAWARRMLEERMFVLVPAANAVGYFRNTREEEGADPNRDFAYDTIKTSCMRTIAARAVNELWRQSIFTLAVTFHGGDNLVAFPWGDTFHCPGFPRNCEPRSVPGGSSHPVPIWTAPDHSAMATLAQHASEHAGPQPENQVVYKHGPLNDIIYPVGGGMEDWMYGASWGPRALGCTPKERGGYATFKSTAGNVTHRAVNLLVEASDVKAPQEIKLGHGAEVTARGGTVGHVSRNIRLMLLVADTAEPYVRIEGVYREYSGAVVRGVGEKEAVRAGEDVVVRWSVGGAFWVDSWRVGCEPADACRVKGTHGGLRRARHAEMSMAECGQEKPLRSAGCVIRATGGEAESVHACQLLHEATLSAPTQTESPRPGCFGADRSWGVCEQGRFLCRGVPAAWEEKWAELHGKGDAIGEGGQAVSYLSTLTVTEAVPGLTVRVTAVVDQDWMREDRVEGRARGPPQSHWVRARGDTTWVHSVPGSVVKGRKEWESDAFLLPVSLDAVPPKGGGVSAASRVVPIPKPEDPPAPPHQQPPPGPASLPPPPPPVALPAAAHAQASLQALVAAPHNASDKYARNGGGDAKIIALERPNTPGAAPSGSSRGQGRASRVSVMMWASPVVLLVVGVGLMWCLRGSRRARRGLKPSGR